MKQKAISWNSRFLSTAGKATMLQSILSATPTFAMTCFQLPVGLCNQIQSVLTRFWWDTKDGDNKICWVAWDKLTLPKRLGGLGFRDVQLFNQALLAKIAWRSITNPGCLLSRVLLGKYCHKSSLLKAGRVSSGVGTFSLLILVKWLAMENQRRSGTTPGLIPGWILSRLVLSSSKTKTF